MTDPVGNVTSYTYGDSSHPYNPTSIVQRAPSGQTINSIQIGYTNTGGAFGLTSSFNKNGSITTFTYDKHGFPSSQTLKTGTQDPDIITTLTSNNRGDITSSTDTLGQKKKYFYDPLSRPTGVEVYDTTESLIDWHFNYYNDNGEIEWEQGARLNPVDYTHYDYDRAGHLLNKTIWLSTASAHWIGEGVDSGDLASTCYIYDPQGNCSSIIDPNGHKTVMTYDPLGNMLSRSLGDGAAQESFSYEPGGKIATHTTILGGKEFYSYTSTGLVQSVSRSDGTTMNCRYDLSGRLVEERASHGPSCSITYEGNSIKRTFSTSGSNLGSTHETYDGRGNLLEQTDLAGNTWKYSYDGLNRITQEEGPATSERSAHQAISHFYSLNFESLVNNIGEWINQSFDAIGRPILTTAFNQDGTIAQNISNHYSGDHQSVATSVGTSSNAITTTTYTDSRGLPIIVEHADGYKICSYDANGNKISFTDKEKGTTSYTYDALNHLTSETRPGGAVIKYTFNEVGELLKRSMPQGLIEQNSYNPSGQKTASSLIGSDGSTTRNYSYSYTNGVLSSIKDPRGLMTSINYDGWGHPTSIVSSGSSIPEQNQQTTYSYDPRGLLTSVAQSYASTSTGTSTLVSRGYDGYGQLTSETTSLNGTTLSSWNQTWDEAGRRVTLSSNIDSNRVPQYHFSYNALGLMTSSQNGSGTCSYTYADNGLLSGKSSPFGTLILARDNLGRIGEEAIERNSDKAMLLYEHLDWKSNDLLLDYKVLGSSLGLLQETRSYNYSSDNRIAQESFTMFNSSNEQALPNGPQIAQYLFDETAFLKFNSGKLNSLGVRTTQVINNKIGNCVTGENSFAQVTQANTYLFGICYDWMLRYDDSGNLINHSLENLTDQHLTWDSFNRLVGVEQKSTLANNFNAQWSKNYSWKTVYDGLGRRIRTTSGSDTIKYYYDPEVEFLELGHSVNGSLSWNLYGPDRTGTYGGAQGIGGLECTYDEGAGITCDHVKNFFGDTVGVYTDTQAAVYPSVLGGYGAMPGSSVGGNLEPQWRGHYIDATGFVSMGARYYDPVDGRFLSPDPLGHDASLSLYDYCNGDPVNGLDPDGRCVEGYTSGYNGGLFAEHENLTQQVAGLVGAAASYHDTLPLALARDYNNAPEGYGKGVARNATFLGNWMAGTLPSTIVYDQNSPETMDMRSSPGAAQIRNDFIKTGEVTRPKLGYGTFQAAKETLPNPSQWAGTALEVGGFDGASITNNGDATATFIVKNRAGAKSFLYHLLPDMPTSWGNVPMHNVEQKFIWTEPIGPISPGPSKKSP